MAFLGHVWVGGPFWAGRRCQILCSFGLFENAPLYILSPASCELQSHTITRQPLGSGPAQPPPHPDGNPKAYLTGLLINPKSLGSGLWQSWTSLGSQHKGYPLWTESSLPFFPPFPRIQVRTWPLSSQGTRVYYHTDAFLWF